MFLIIQPFGTPKNGLVHAAVVTTQQVIDLMGRDLSGHFRNYTVSLVEIAPAVFYGPDAVTLILTGKEENIKKSLRQLKRVCFGKEIGLERTPVRSVPPTLKGYLSDMEDSIRFEKLFNYCSKEY